MREIRQSGSEGGEAGNLTGLPYPYQVPGALRRPLHGRTGVRERGRRFRLAQDLPILPRFS